MTDILNDPIKALTEYVSYPSVSMTPHFWMVFAVPESSPQQGLRNLVFP